MGGEGGGQGRGGSGGGVRKEGREGGREGGRKRRRGGRKSLYFILSMSKCIGTWASHDHIFYSSALCDRDVPLFY